MDLLCDHIATKHIVVANSDKIKHFFSWRWQTLSYFNASHLDFFRLLYTEKVEYCLVPLVILWKLWLLATKIKPSFRICSHTLIFFDALHRDLCKHAMKHEYRCVLLWFYGSKTNCISWKKLFFFKNMATENWNYLILCIKTCCETRILLCFVQI